MPVFLVRILTLIIPALFAPAAAHKVLAVRAGRGSAESLLARPPRRPDVLPGTVFRHSSSS